MSRLFNPDNGFFTFINKAIDTFWLGLLWFVISLGLVVASIFIGIDAIFFASIFISSFLIGPASSALYYATVKVTRRSRSYATKEFFRSFKLNFKVASPMSFIYSLFAYLMYIDIQYANALIDEGNSFGNVMFAVFIAGSIFAGVSLAWAFPILSRFTVSLGGLFRNAILIATRHLVRSFILILLWAVVGVLVYVFYEFLLYLIILIPLIPGLLSLVRSFIIEPVLKKYTSESEGTPEETGIDEWYRE